MSLTASLIQVCILGCLTAFASSANAQGRTQTCPETCFANHSACGGGAGDCGKALTSCLLECRSEVLKQERNPQQCERLRGILNECERIHMREGPGACAPQWEQVRTAGCTP
jgi:hypothetical protein